MGKSIEDFSFFCDNIEIKSEKNFINGKGLLITNESGINSKNFSIQFTPLLNDSITFSSREIELNENPTTKIDLLSETFVVLNKNFSKECFSVKSDSKEILYLNAFSKQGVNVYHVNSSDYNHVFCEKKIIDSDYFLFDLSSSNVFCLDLIEKNLSSTTVNFFSGKNYGQLEHFNANFTRRGIQILFKKFYNGLSQTRFAKQE